MKHFILIYLLTFLIFSNLANAQEPTANPKIVLTIQADKTECKFGDEITFHLVFKNLSGVNQYLFINKIYPAKIFQLHNAKGDLLGWQQNVIYDVAWNVNDYKLIFDNGVYTQDITAKIKELDGRVILDFKDSRIVLDELGSYTGSIAYKGWVGTTKDETTGKEITICEKYKMKNCFDGELKSNEINFKIIN
ncbi:MAG: hypothetical protein HQL25_05535 [Candidatus Omnitrophica bacterium]|nr:hypothetical protein [Candidatus Omnitrophota bacterium]